MTLDLINGTSISTNSFSQGLQFWRSNLLDINSSKLNTASNVSLVSESDAVGGSALVGKSTSSLQIVHDATIGISTGTYLEVKFNVTLTSGASPNVRVIASPADNSGQIISGFTTNGPSTQILNGISTEISAIIGSGAKPGVDLAWGHGQTNAYVGLELNGANGGTILVDSIEITDVTSAFIVANTDWVDIRDYGGVGNGSTDCYQAFLAADADADGRAIFIPEGNFYIGQDITLHSPIRPYGRIVAEKTTAVMLANIYNLETYVNVFKNETVAFEKALQALFKFSDHSGLDLGGRSIDIAAPVDVSELLGDINSFVKPRTIYNGRFNAKYSNAWTVGTVTANAQYVPQTNSTTLTNVANIQDIEVGSHVYGNGVGREVYVISKDIASSSLELSDELYAASSSQSYTFTRFRFLLDFSGLQELKYFEINNCEFELKGRASMILMAYDGIACKFTHLYIRGPRDRGICSYHRGCGGLTVESCNLESWEWTEEAKDRTTIAVSLRRNDMKIRNNRATYFRHFAALAGTGHIVMGNHWFQGNPRGGSSRTAGVVTMGNQTKTLFVGNYCDNSWIELSHEYESNPTNFGASTYGGLTVTGNIFTIGGEADDSFRYIKIAPYATNRTLDGILVNNNVFECYVAEGIRRVEGVVTTNGSFDNNKTRNVIFTNNSFSKVEFETHSPARKIYTQSSNATKWTIDFSDALPFGGFAHNVDALTCKSDVAGDAMPRYNPLVGTGKNKVELSFPSAVKGTVVISASVNMD